MRRKVNSVEINIATRYFVLPMGLRCLIVFQFLISFMSFVTPALVMASIEKTLVCYNPEVDGNYPIAIFRIQALQQIRVEFWVPSTSYRMAAELKYENLSHLAWKGKSYGATCSVDPNFNWVENAKERKSYRYLNCRMELDPSTGFWIFLNRRSSGTYAATAKPFGSRKLIELTRCQRSH